MSQLRHIALQTFFPKEESAQSPWALLSIGMGRRIKKSLRTLIAQCSHLHWDHVGDWTEFPSAQLILGPGATEYVSPGYPSQPDSAFLGAVFNHAGGVRELSRATDTWVPFPPFERAFDLFSDGSLLLVDAPGHMPGHLIAVARTSASGTMPEFVIMGGDCCHHRSLFTGEAEIGVGFGPTGLPSMHLDLDIARKTIQRVGELGREENILVCLAHDAFLHPPLELFPDTVNGWRERDVKAKIEAERKTRREDIKACPL